MHTTTITGFSSKPIPRQDDEEAQDPNAQHVGDPDDVYIAPTANVGIGSYRLKPKPHEERPADPEKDIPELFWKMKPQREQLLAIIDFCREERTSEEVDAMLEPLMAHRRSVYTPLIMRDLLLRNGALEYLVEDAEDDGPDEDASPEPAETLTDDLTEEGVQFLEVPEEKAGTWLSTPAALAFIESCDSRTAIDDMLAEKPELEPLYRLILKECAEEPRSTKHLDELVESHPLAQNPQRFGSFFVGKLEDVDALTWEGAWKTTDAARYLLEEDR